MSELVIDRQSLTRSTRITRSSIARPALAALLVALAYYLGVKIGFALTFQPHPVSTLWPPNSILLAALLLAPKRWWWFLFLAVLPVHFGVELQSGVPLLMVTCWYISNCCEALIGALIIIHFANGVVRFDSARYVAVFIFAAVLAPFLSSFLDAGFVILNHFGSGGYWQVWRMRFFSNVLAELTLVPFIVMWIGEGRAGLQKLTLYRYLEASALLLGLGLVGILVLNGRSGVVPTPALLYAPLPLLSWAAVRFGPKGISTALVLVTLMATVGAIHGLGPFVLSSPEDNALSVQLFLILNSIPLLTLGAVIHKQRHLKQVARNNEEQLELALDSAQMGTWDWHITNNETRWSDGTKRMFGLMPEDPEGPPEVFYELLHEDDRQLVREAIERSIRECGPYEAEFRVLQPDGSIRWIRGSGKVLKNESGKSVRMVGVNADITKPKEADEQLRSRNGQIRTLVGALISAQEDERRRLSRELHDDFSQRIAALSVAISKLKRKLPSNSEQLAAELDQLYSQMNELTDHVRQLSHDLHPPALEHLGLKRALEIYVNQFQHQEGINVYFTARLKSEKIRRDISVCLYRIALEGLRNVVKHSQAKSASISLEEDGNWITMEIADTGVGFNVSEARNGQGLGLVSIHERIRLLQGKFEINSARSTGTTLMARIPV
jgi:PAS domain S-box-containing protein